MHMHNMHVHVHVHVHVSVHLKEAVVVLGCRFYVPRAVNTVFKAKTFGGSGRDIVHLSLSHHTHDHTGGHARHD